MLHLAHTLGLPGPTCKEACLAIGSERQATRAAGAHSADDPEVNYQQYFPSSPLVVATPRTSVVDTLLFDRSFWKVDSDRFAPVQAFW